ncbi:polyketide cyclase/dehydrase/lipid transport protein [Litoreibacter ponti]|uniref:Polyketide cyclase/dehydrase/lipid transport protein n=1 Tax=Litoreibacter ponti TaxID=1510457 RepID=A0A2T6BKV0_9RHOB|nr:SRPBCC family protein [Litoreibacter ponti]PTX56694.1 polyketide cyclase/dehydrase/lipid transport protein [Litoreibacter ponti]
MRLLKWIIGGLAGLVLALALIGMLLPREVEVSRSTVIDAPPRAVFPHVNNLKATEAWSPWLGIDPNVQTTFGPIAEGVGARMEWASDHPNVGNGAMEVIESVENATVVSALDFGEMGLATARHVLLEQDGKTEITWSLEVDMGAGPVGRWMGLMMDGWVGADYERGLANLKTLVES